MYRYDFEVYDPDAKGFCYGTWSSNCKTLRGAWKQIETFLLRHNTGQELRYLSNEGHVS